MEDEHEQEKQEILKNFEAEKHDKRTLESKIKSLADHGMSMNYQEFWILNLPARVIAFLHFHRELHFQAYFEIFLFLLVQRTEERLNEKSRDYSSLHQRHSEVAWHHVIKTSIVALIVASCA